MYVGHSGDLRRRMLEYRNNGSHLRPFFEEALANKCQLLYRFKALVCLWHDLLYAKLPANMLIIVQLCRTQSTQPGQRSCSYCSSTTLPGTCARMAQRGTWQSRRTYVAKFCAAGGTSGFASYHTTAGRLSQKSLLLNSDRKILQVVSKPAKPTEQAIAARKVVADLPSVAVAATAK